VPAAAGARLTDRVKHHQSSINHCTSPRRVCQEHQGPGRSGRGWLRLATPMEPLTGSAAQAVTPRQKKQQQKPTSRTRGKEDSPFGFGPPPGGTLRTNEPAQHRFLLEFGPGEGVRRPASGSRFARPCKRKQRAAGIDPHAHSPLTALDCRAGPGSEDESTLAKAPHRLNGHRAGATG